MLKFTRSKCSWCIASAPSGETGCLETLALKKGYRISDICAALGCSNRNLYVVFMRDIGLPPKQWVDLERMVVAKRKLEGGKSISEVACDLSYSSHVAFSRRFERVYGIPPGRFVKCRRVFDPPVDTEPDHSKNAD
jgi:AraC-like DNA-binding protein